MLDDRNQQSWLDDGLTIACLIVFLVFVLLVGYELGESMQWIVKELRT